MPLDDFSRAQEATWAQTLPSILSSYYQAIYLFVAVNLHHFIDWDFHKTYDKDNNLSDLEEWY